MSPIKRGSTDVSFRVGSTAVAAMWRGSEYYSVDNDAAAYIAAVEAADTQKLEPAVARAINDFVAGCKSDGTWTAIKASCILMGARTLSGALKPLAGTAPTNVNFVAADYNRKTGLLGNGTTKYLNSNRATNAESQDSVHLAVYKTTSTSGINPYYIGAQDSASSYTVVGKGGMYVRTTAPMAAGEGDESIGLHAAARSSNTACSSKRPGASVLAATASSIAITKSDTFYVLAYNESGTPTALSASRFAFYSIGQNLDLALLDARVSALYTAIGAAI